jgi:hypothetical protein
VKEVDLKTHESGLVRDTTEGKTNWMLVFDGPMLERYAQHLTKGARNKGRRNWLKAGSNPNTAQADLDRFLEGFARHVAQYLMGEEDEDHAAAIIFNLNGAELVKAKMRGGEHDS